MLDYNKYEKFVFDWLYEKYQKEPSFTFSLRRKATKNAESNYFIGKEKLKYFGTTFWTIPVSFPGSSSDFFDLFFSYSKEKKLTYFFEIKQTSNPDDEQNKIAFELAKKLKLILKQEFATYKESNQEKSEGWCKVFGKNATGYDNINDLFNDLEQDLNKIIPIVDAALIEIKEKNPSFIGHRITHDEFNEYLKKKDSRMKKNKDKNGIKVIDSNEDGCTKIEDRRSPEKNPLNQIFFGPPGTGKTYSTVNEAIAIVNPDFDLSQERNEIKKEFDRLMQEGQIVFTTFHQSMSYEDFIEGIKPIEPKEEGQPVIYKVVSGILKVFCERIKNLEKLTASNLPTAISVSNFNELYSAFVTKLKQIISELEENETHFFESRRSKVKLIKIDGDSILTTGETANSTETITRLKLERIYNKFESPDEITNIPKQIREVGTDIGWTTNYFAVFKALKEFEGSIKTIGMNNISSHRNQKFILIIDEINRGNISQIFGELITLIEEDKRIDNDEALKVTLPYSKVEFGIPSNLYIIGTMNTADRSVEALDAALRRRFSFVEMQPRPDLIATDGKLKDKKGAIGTIDLPLLLGTINKRLEKLLDKDHQIGHSYFMNVTSLDELKVAFQNKIIPLLQEYFFGDYGKIGLVLGNGFVRKKIWDKTESSFADFDSESLSDFDDKDVYEIINYTPPDFKGYEIKIKKDKELHDVSMTFEKAIKLLMKQDIE